MYRRRPGILPIQGAPATRELPKVAQQITPEKWTLREPQGSARAFRREIGTSKFAAHPGNRQTRIKGVKSYESENGFHHRWGARCGCFSARVCTAVPEGKSPR